MARIGALIRRARTEHGLGVKELASLAGVSPATVSQIERNLRPAVSFAMADQILCAMDLRLNIEIVPLWADIDEAIDQARRQPLAERIKTWPVDFPAYVTIFDGLPYLLDGLTSAAVQGVPVRVEEFEIAIPRDDDVLDRFTALADQYAVRRGGGFERADPREPGSDYYRCVAGRLRLRIVEQYQPVLWVDIDPLPEPDFPPVSFSTLSLAPEVSRARIAVVPLTEIQASDNNARRILRRIAERRMLSEPGLARLLPR
jgi:transcriptional regulator with XRE-family HTH domain